MKRPTIFGLTLSAMLLLAGVAAGCASNGSSGAPGDRYTSAGPGNPGNGTTTPVVAHIGK